MSTVVVTMVTVLVSHTVGVVAKALSQSRLACVGVIDLGVLSGDGGLHFVQLARDGGQAFVQPLYVVGELSLSCSKVEVVDGLSHRLGDLFNDALVHLFQSSLELTLAHTLVEVFRTLLSSMSISCHGNKEKHKAEAQ